MRKTQIEKAIESIDSKIATLQAARAELVAQQAPVKVIRRAVPRKKVDEVGVTLHA